MDPSTSHLYGTRVANRPDASGVLRLAPHVRRDQFLPPHGSGASPRPRSGRERRPRRRAETRGHDGDDRPSRAFDPGPLRGVGGQHPADRHAGLRGAVHLRLGPEPAAEPREVVGGRPRRQDHHVQAAGGRDLPQRQAVHQRRRAVLLHGDPEEVQSDRAGHARGTGRRRHAGPDDRDPAARQSGALHHEGALRAGPADPVPLGLRGHGRPPEPQRQQADRHRAVQVRELGAGPVRAPGPQRAVLEARPAVSQPDRRPVHPGRGHALGRHGGGGGAFRRVQRGELRRPRADEDQPDPRSDDQGLRDDAGPERPGAERPSPAAPEEGGAPGDRLRHRPQGHPQGRDVRLRPARHRPAQPQVQDRRPLHRRRPPVRRAGPAGHRQPAARRGRRPARRRTGPASPCTWR